MKRICLLLIFALTACGESAVTQVHIDKATQLCAPNGGMAKIKEGHWSQEQESCGYRCSRHTGRHLYEARVQCMNGAAFEVEFVQ
jgi:hypothetical protein